MSFLQFIELLVTFTLVLSKHSTGRTGKPLCFFDETVRFSTDNPNTYYECNSGQKYAVLKRCPPNEHYSSEKERCRPIKKKGREKRAAAEKKSKALKVLNYKILNQDVRLGDFYDARNNQFLSGTSLWSPTVLRKIKKENRNIITSFKTLFKTGKTTSDRLDIMDIKAELKLSFLGGLIEVTGSAGFARKGDLTEIDETFTLVYRTRAYSATIPKSTPVSFNKECKNKYATHVANKITYGQNAYFFFKHTLRKEEQSQTVSGSLSVVVKSIPQFTIEGKASIDLKGNLKEFAQTTEVQYNGDFRLKNGIPTTFDSAINTFKELPHRTATGPNFEGAVPVEVQLTPLSDYCKESNTILENIGSSAITKVSEVLESLEFLLMKVKALLQSQPAVLYPAVGGNLKHYKTNLELFQLKLKGKLQVLLPAIRGRLNGKSETDLLELLTEYKQSPFERANSTGYLLKRGREIKAINFLTKGINTAQKNFEIADYKRANGVKTIINYRKVVIFSVNILLSSQITKDFLAGNKIDESVFWYENVTSVGLLGYQKRLFMNFAMANKNLRDTAYLIKITKRAAYPLNINAQTNGITDNKAFVIPDKPSNPISLSHSHNTFVIKVEKPMYNVGPIEKKVNPWVTKFYVEYWRLIDGRGKGMEKVLFDFSTTTTAIIKNLKPLTSYQYRIVYYTEFGLSPPSKVGDVTTTQFSEPANLNLIATNVETLSFSWDKPIEIAKGITIDGYKATLFDGSKKHAEKTVSVKQLSFGNLNPRTKYVINVVAVSSKFESLPAIMIAYTTPRPPHAVKFVKADLNAITFTWSQPNIATGATIKEYAVKYVKMNNKGSNTIPATEKSKSALKHTSIKITDLAQNTTYGFSVQVITVLNGGKLSKSRHSKYLVEKTKSKISELENLRETMENKFVIPLVNKLKMELMAELQTQAQKIQQLAKNLNTEINKSPLFWRRFLMLEQRQNKHKDLTQKLRHKIDRERIKQDRKLLEVQRSLIEKVKKQDERIKQIRNKFKERATRIHAQWTKIQIHRGRSG